jgi:putative flavoprotein involved in K+ transport
MTTTTTTEAHDWLARFGDALARQDIEGACALFEPQQCFWRDLVAFSWNIVTCESQEAIREMLAATLAHTQPSAWTIEGSPETQAGMLTASFRFETATGRGQGLLRLREGRCWTLLTVLDELKGFEEKSRHRRVKGAEHGADTARVTWLEKRQREEAALGYEEQPYTVIIGGGQGGIGLAARLRRLGVPTLVIEKNEKPGDSWRNRYKSLHLHDPVWYDHLPYLKFPDDWPVFAAKDKIGDWLEHYTRIMELNYWGGTECVGAEYDDGTQEWAVSVLRDGEPVTLRPKQLVFALGVSGYPNIPAFDGAQSFLGEQRHSSQHPGGGDWTGKKAVVIGSNNSAHDICADLWEHGADVTMVQRSSTHIARSESLMDLALGDLYSEKALAATGHHREGRPAVRVPARTASCPEAQVPVYQEMAEAGRGVLLAAGGRRVRPGLRRGRVRPVREVPAARLRLLHRRRRLPADHRRPGEAEVRAGRQDHRQRRGDGRRHRAGGRPDRLRHRVRLHERLAGGPGVSRRSRTAWASAGDTAQTRRKTLARGRGSCAICGNQPTSPTSGSTAATCTRAGTTPLTWPCSSRPGWRDWRRRWRRSEQGRRALRPRLGRARR